VVDSCPSLRMYKYAKVLLVHFSHKWVVNSAIASFG
jgi:hypothetical protein